MRVAAQHRARMVEAGVADGGHPHVEIPGLVTPPQAEATSVRPRVGIRPLAHPGFDAEPIALGIQDRGAAVADVRHRARVDPMDPPSDGAAPGAGQRHPGRRQRPRSSRRHQAPPVQVETPRRDGSGHEWPSRDRDLRGPGVWAGNRYPRMRVPAPRGWHEVSVAGIRGATDATTQPALRGMNHRTPVETSGAGAAGAGIVPTLHLWRPFAIPLGPSQRSIPVTGGVGSRPHAVGHPQRHHPRRRRQARDPRPCDPALLT